MGLWLVACKEINGLIYVTRLPKAIDDHTPGIPDTWHFVGPGTRPSVQEYSGNEFILTFEYLSHLFARVMDIGTWPPTQVNPVQQSGGPNPPNAITYNVQFPADAFAFKLQSNSSTGTVAAFFNPPVITPPVLFLDPVSGDYSVTITLDSGWHPEVPANETAFYRLYRRPIGSSSWTRIVDWTTSLEYTETDHASLRFQFSATWGSQFLATAQHDPTQHAEGIIGQSFVTVDSTVDKPSYQSHIHEPLTLDRSSINSYAFMGDREVFFSESPNDEIALSKSLLGRSSQSYGFFFDRQAFVIEALSDEMIALDTSLNPSTNSAHVFMG